MSNTLSNEPLKKAKKTVTRNLRMTEKEVKELDEFLNEIDMSFSAFVRQAVSLRQPLKSSKPARRYKAPLPQVDPDLLLELGRIGNNINQIARSLNYINADQLLRAELSFIECLKILQRIQDDIHVVIGKLPKINRSDEAVKRIKQRALEGMRGRSHAD